MRARVGGREETTPGDELHAKEVLSDAGGVEKWKRRQKMLKCQ